MIPSLSSAASDYVTVDKNITFSSDERQYSLELQILDDSVVENTESFVLSLSLPSNKQVVQLGTYDSISIKIVDDDSECGSGGDAAFA